MFKTSKRTLKVIAFSLLVSCSCGTQAFTRATPYAPTRAAAVEKSPILILSIDGAAARGIAQFEILSGLEAKFNEEIKKTNPKAPKIAITDIFDFFAGTSAGSINIGAMLIPDKDGKPKMGLDEIKKKLPETIEAAFSSTTFRKARVMGGLLGSKYSAKPLEALLQENAGSTKMDNLVKPAIITSYDVSSKEVMNFSTYDSCRKGTDSNVYLWQAMRASSAAPVFYKPLELFVNGKMRTLIDAGIFVMSPALLSWVEAQKMFPDRKYVIISVSGGTMQGDRKYQAKGATAGSIPAVLEPTIETALEGQQAITEKMMRDIPNVEFHRITFNVANKKFDDFSEKNINALKESARMTVKSEGFNDAVKSLVKVHSDRMKYKLSVSFKCGM